MTSYNELVDWMVSNYPKLYNHICENYKGLCSFCDEMGCVNYEYKSWDVEMEFIERNKHLHDLWML